MTEALWSLPPERSGQAAGEALVQRRMQLSALVAAQISAPGVPIRETVIGGVKCVEAGHVAAPVLLYAHGGGFRMGEAGLWEGFASRIAQAVGVRVVLPDYRLAPEYPFPAALRDVCAVYHALLDGPSRTMLIGGDSAGGGLACSAAIAAMNAGAPSPAGAVLISPWLDLTLTAGTYESNAATDPIFSRAAAQEAAAAYLQGEPAHGPLASPLLGLPDGFPPVLVFASAAEVLAGDALAVTRARVEGGGVVEAVFEPGLPHVWPIMTPAAPATEAVVERIAAFFSRRLD